jgi:hypothetical protein
MNAMDGTNRRSRGVGKAASADKWLQRHPGQRTRRRLEQNESSVHRANFGF